MQTEVKNRQVIATLIVCFRKNQHVQYKESIYGHFNNRFSFASTSGLSQNTFSTNQSATIPSVSCSCDHIQTTPIGWREDYTPPLPPNHPTLDRHNPTQRLQQSEYNTYDSIEGVYSYCTTPALETPQYQAPIPRPNHQTYTELRQSSDANVPPSAKDRKGSDQGLVTRPLGSSLPPRAPTRRDDQSGGYIYLEEVQLGGSSSQHITPAHYDDINSLKRSNTIVTSQSSQFYENREVAVPVAVQSPDEHQDERPALLVTETIPSQPSEDGSSGTDEQGVDNRLYFLDNDMTLTDMVMQALDSDDKEAVALCSQSHQDQGESNSAFVDEPDYYVDPQYLVNNPDTEILPPPPPPPPGVNQPDQQDL